MEWCRPGSNTVMRMDLYPKYPNLQERVRHMEVTLPTVGNWVAISRSPRPVASTPPRGTPREREGTLSPLQSDPHHRSLTARCWAYLWSGRTPKVIPDHLSRARDRHRVCVPRHVLQTRPGDRPGKRRKIVHGKRRLARHPGMSSSSRDWKLSCCNYRLWNRCGTH